MQSRIFRRTLSHACDDRQPRVTAYLQNGGTLEHAQQIAAHESPRKTKLYGRTTDEIALHAIEHIANVAVEQRPF